MPNEQCERRLIAVARQCSIAGQGCMKLPRSANRQPDSCTTCCTSCAGASDVRRITVLLAV